MTLIRRAARVLLQGAARLAPRASRGWSTAMLNELDHVEGDLASLQWALGGTAALCRHALVHRFPRRALAWAVVVTLGLMVLAAGSHRSVAASRPAPLAAPGRP